MDFEVITKKRLNLNYFGLLLATLYDFDVSFRLAHYVLVAEKGSFWFSSTMSHLR